MKPKVLVFTSVTYTFLLSGRMYSISTFLLLFTDISNVVISSNGFVGKNVKTTL